jgi:hypothetical protein
MRRLRIYPLSRPQGEVIKPVIGGCLQIAVRDRYAVVFCLNKGD